MTRLPLLFVLELLAVFKPGLAQTVVGLCATDTQAGVRKNLATALKAAVSLSTVRLEPRSG